MAEEVDSLALANVQLNLEGAFGIFREPEWDFRIINQKNIRGNPIQRYGKWEYLSAGQVPEMPKMQPVKIKLHRMIRRMEAEISDCEQRTVGKYFASCCSTVKTKQRRKDRRKNSWGWILPCMGCVYFLPVKEPDIPCFTGMQRKSLPGTEKTFQM